MLLLNKINILVSYAYIRQGTWFEKGLKPLANEINFLLDSGAFTAFQSENFTAEKGKGISLSNYISFLRQNKTSFWQYIQLDRIGDPIQTLQNFNEMQQAGLNPMGVLTLGMDYGLVNELTKKNKYYCVAGGVGTRLDFALSRYQKAHQQNPNGKIHALGFVRFPEMFQCPIYSVDSSSSSAGRRYGNIQFYQKNKGVKSRPAREVITDKTNKHQDIKEDLLNCGVTTSVLANNFSLDFGVSLLSGYNAYLNFAEECNERGKRYFFVITGLSQLCGILGVVAHKQGLYYDYAKARNTARSLNDLHKAKEYDKLNEIGKNILRENTKWQEQIGL